MQYYLHEVSPFGHPRIKACEAAPRGFSQPSTSFIGVLRQGILYVRLTNFLRHAFAPRQPNSGKAEISLPLAANRVVASCGTPSRY
jgi:hypothetical protein